MKLKLWLIERKDAQEHVGYDEAYGFVVRADSSKQARELAVLRCGDEGKELWRDREKSTCSRLTDEGIQGVILRDFNGS